MINWLHSYIPDPILLSLGSVNIYWYGFFVAIGIALALWLTIWLGQKHGLAKEKIIDLCFWLIIFGIIGARLYHIMIEWDYYLGRPAQALMIWKGGLAIHGGIIAGLLTTYYFYKKQQINFWLLTSIIVPGLALAQAVGRWGNYFNQELFGLPTDLPWGIPINVMARPTEYIVEKFFHPTFLYESLGSLIIFIILLSAHFYVLKKQKRDNNTDSDTNVDASTSDSINKNANSYLFITLGYLMLYSVLRFVIELVRIDHTLLFFGWRWPQVISILIILCSIAIIIYRKRKFK